MRTSEVITLPQAEQEYSEGNEQTTRRTLEQYLADLRADIPAWTVSNAGDIYNTNASGKVGIGTSSPLTLLHIQKEDLTITASVNDSYIGLYEGKSSTNAYISMVGDADKNVGFRFGGVAKLDKAMVFWDDLNEVVTIRTYNGAANVDGLEVDKDGGVVVDGTATGHSKGLGTLNVKNTIYLNGGVLWTSGSGTPESAVTAPVGSMYSRTDGGAGTSLYVKESGSGNTGWVGK
jgi:hypothetical protein